jgi:CRP-like cAMP-binding protein
MRPWQIRRFILASALIDYAKGDAVFEPGSDSMAMYLVIKGEVEVRVPEKGDQGKYIVVSRFGPGELFGDVAVLADSRRKTRAVACGATTLLVVGRDSIYNVVHYHPFIASRIFYNLSTDVSRRWVRFISKVDSTEGASAKPVPAGAHDENAGAGGQPGGEK